MSTWFVILLGLSTVFIGLILLICICKIMSWFCLTFVKERKSAPAPATAPAAIPNKPEFVAAVGAVIAEELGTDVSGIRIRSIKKI